MSGKNWKPCARDGCKNIGVSKGYCSWHRKQMRKNAKLVRVSASSLAKIEEVSKLSLVSQELVTQDAIECGLISDQFEAIYGPMIEFRTKRDMKYEPSSSGELEKYNEPDGREERTEADSGGPGVEGASVPAPGEGDTGVSYGDDAGDDSTACKQRFEGTGDDGLGLAYRPD